MFNINGPLQEKGKCTILQEDVGFTIEEGLSLLVEVPSTFITSFSASRMTFQADLDKGDLRITDEHSGKSFLCKVCIHGTFAENCQ